MIRLYIGQYTIFFHSHNLKFSVNPLPAQLPYFNFQPLEVVSRYRDPQL